MPMDSDKDFRREEPRTRPKLVFLTNVVAPYRMALMERLARVFETSVLYSGEEPNRKEWRVIAEVGASRVRLKKSWGVVLNRSRRRYEGLFDHSFVHVTPGYALDLIKCRPDAVISAELGFRTLVALAYSKITRVPLWVWWGGTRHTEANISRVKRLMRSAVARLVPRWLSYGLTSTEYLLDLGVPRERVLQIQNCVDEALYQAPSEPYAKMEPKPVVLCAGRLVPGKGVALLLETAALLQHEGLAFSLLIVGSGIHAPRLRAMVTTLGLQNVMFVDGVESTRMPSVYRSADLVVLPTLADVWGLVINEALWSGVPVLASLYAGASRELLPPASVFDPLDRRDFLTKLRAALLGGLDPVDTSPLLKIDAVAELIANDILGSVHPSPRYRPLRTIRERQ